MSNATANPQQSEVVKGMKGVVAAETSLSYIDGEKGTLIYRGYAIEDLAKHSTFEETTYLLWRGKLPNKAELAAFNAELAAERKLPKAVRDMIRLFPNDATPLAVMRTAVSMLGEFDPDGEDNSEAANARKAARLTSQSALILAAFLRQRQGLELPESKPELGLAANLLWLISGEVPSKASERVLDMYLVLLADHGLNASTFGAMVTAGTAADFHGCMTTAIGTLKGPLHGGANRAAMEMLEKIPDPEAAKRFVADAIARKEKIMGFGHRVYKTKDPRGTCLYEAAVKVLKERGEENMLAICQTIERELFAAKGLHYNVDFYSAPVLASLGFPTDAFVDLFAISRMAGWAAHVIEYNRDPALLRPRAKYVGPESAVYVPIERRS